MRHLRCAIGLLPYTAAPPWGFSQLGWRLRPVSAPTLVVVRQRFPVRLKAVSSASAVLHYYKSLLSKTAISVN